MAFCIPMLGAALPRAYAQSLLINNDTNVSFGVRFQIRLTNVVTPVIVLDTCVTVAAYDDYSRTLGPYEFLYGTKIQCEDCGEENPYVSSSSYPESRESFLCGEIRYSVEQAGDVVNIYEP